MSFVEKLRSLVAAEKKEKEFLISQIAEQEARQQKELEEDRIAPDKLVKFTEEKLVPIFQTINSEYLNEQGEVNLSSQGPKNDAGRPVIPHASLSLNWTRADSPPWLKEGLTLTVFSDFICLEGGDYNEESELSRMEFRLDDENWEKKLEDGILRYLSTPEACVLHISVGGKPREDN